MLLVLLLNVAIVILDFLLLRYSERIRSFSQYATSLSCPYDWDIYYTSRAILIDMFKFFVFLCKDVVGDVKKRC